jgi:hypothetical protein
MGGADMFEAGFSRELEEFDRLRQQQHRGRGEQNAVRHRDDGADGAAVSGLLVIVLWNLLIARGRVRGILAHEVRSTKEVGLRCRGLESGSGLYRMEVAERQHKLDGEREQRQPCAEFDVFSNPLHESAPTPGTTYPNCPDVIL